MEIIENNYKEDKKDDYIYVCDNCNSKLNVEENDLKVGELGNYYFVCPCCGEKVFVDKSLKLNENNIKFPQHYYKCNDDSTVKISDEQIDAWVKACIKDCKEHNLDYRYMSSGDSIVFCMKDETEEEYIITVAKDYYESFISY